MRAQKIGGWIAACTMFAVASTSLAKGKPQQTKDAGSERNAGMMEAGEKDPAETETTADEGQFVPGKDKPPAKGSADDAAANADDASDDGSSAAKSEQKPEPKAELAPRAFRKTLAVFAEGLLGFGAAPVPGPASAVTGETTTGSSSSYAFLAGASYDLSPKLRVSLRVPWTIGTTKDPTGQDSSVNALGNVELAGTYRLTDPGNTEWAVRLGIGLPTAQGNPDATDLPDATGWTEGRLQTIADAANGWHDQELYATKRLPITPALTFRHRADRLRVGAEFKAAIMPKIGGSIFAPSPNGDGSYLLNGVAFTAVLGGTASYEVLDHVHAALTAWIAYVASPSLEYSSAAVSPSPFQFVVEPRLLAQFGKVIPSAGVVLPLGGQLGGNIYGLRLHVDVLF